MLVLRRDRVEHDRFRAPAVLPVLAIGSCVLLLGEQEARTWLLGAGRLLVGAVLYVLSRAPWWDRRPADATAADAGTR